MYETVDLILEVVKTLCAVIGCFNGTLALIISIVRNIKK